MEEQILRKPKPLPRIIINNRNQSIDDFAYADFELLKYNPYDHIKMEISV